MDSIVCNFPESNILNYYYDPSWDIGNNVRQNDEDRVVDLVQ
jgi:hypothetical protein